MQHFLSKSHWDSPPASQRGKKVTLNPPVFQGDISKGGADPAPNFESGGQSDILNYRLFCLTVFPNLLPHGSHEIVHIET